MRTDTVTAIIAPDLQNDLVAALHARNVGHLARVLRPDRGPLLDQLGRAGIEIAKAPSSLADAERVLVVTAAHLAPEIGWLLLQRGATSVWIVSPDGSWRPMDDMPIEIAATAALPPRSIPPAHRSERTFRQPKHRRRSRYVPDNRSPRSDRSSES